MAAKMSILVAEFVEPGDQSVVFYFDFGSIICLVFTNNGLVYIFKLVEQLFQLVELALYFLEKMYRSKRSHLLPLASRDRRPTVAIKIRTYFVLALLTLECIFSKAQVGQVVDLLFDFLDSI